MTFSLPNGELAVLAIAMFLSTMNIFVYSWFESRQRYVHVGLLVIKLTGVLPSLLFTVWAMYIQATSTESTLGLALLSAGLCLVAGSIQIQAMLRRRLGNSADK